MPIRASSVLFISAHITATKQTIALWSAFWWVPMKQTPLRTSAPIASPSVRSNFSAAVQTAADSFFVDGKEKKEYDKGVVGYFCK